MNFLSKISFYALFVASLFIVSCSTEVSESELRQTDSKIELTEDNFEEWAAQFVDPNQEVEIENATFEEINLALKEAGLPLLSEDILRKQTGVERSGIFPCTTWTFFGDWNGDGTLNVLDLVLARRFQCALVGCGVPFNVAAIPVGTPDALQAINFATLSFFIDHTPLGVTIFDDQDFDALTNLILGIIICS